MYNLFSLLYILFISVRYNNIHSDRIDRYLCQILFSFFFFYRLIIDVILIRFRIIFQFGSYDNIFLSEIAFQQINSKRRWRHSILHLFTANDIMSVFLLLMIVWEKFCESTFYDFCLLQMFMKEFVEIVFVKW